MNESNSRRPPVDAAEAAVFGRPSDVTGGFDARYTPESRQGRAAEQSPGENHGDGMVGGAQPPESLSEAFGRPAGAGDVGLQRPSDAAEDLTVSIPEAPLWGDESEPWRDPDARVALGRPALADVEEEPSSAEHARSAMLSLPEVLFGRRVKPRSLLVLALVALLVGAGGGVVGWGAATLGESLGGELHVAEAEAGKERAPGSVADIASKV